MLWKAFFRCKINVEIPSPELALAHVRQAASFQCCMPLLRNRATVLLLCPRSRHLLQATRITDRKEARTLMFHTRTDRIETSEEVMRTQGILRRSFMSYCALTTTALGLGPAFAPRIAHAMKTKPRRFGTGEAEPAAIVSYAVPNHTDAARRSNSCMSLPAPGSGLSRIAGPMSRFVSGQARVVERPTPGQTARRSLGQHEMFMLCSYSC